MNLYHFFLMSDYSNIITCLFNYYHVLNYQKSQTYSILEHGEEAIITGILIVEYLVRV